MLKKKKLVILLLILLIFLLLFLYYNKSREQFQNEEQSVTIVSAYYPVKSKRTTDKYIESIKNVWSQVSCNLVFFTNKELTPFIEDVRKNFKNKTKIFTLELDEFEALKKYPEPFWKKQHERDYENFHHSNELYTIWFEKKEFVMKAIDNNPFNSEYFIWCDAGIRLDNDILEKSKNLPFLINKIPQDKILLLKIKDFSDKSIDTDFEKMREYLNVGATVIPGSINAWKQFNREYDEMMQYYIETNRFAGKEQNIMTSMVIKNKDLYEMIDIIQDDWSTLYYYLLGINK